MEDLSKNYAEGERPLSPLLSFEGSDQTESNESTTTTNTNSNVNVSSAQTTKTTTKQNTSQKRNLNSDEVQTIKEIKEVKARTPSTPMVLDDDAYVNAVDSIIQRDFFPDLPKLRAQLEWLEATEGGDIERLRTLQKYIVDAENQLKKRKIENSASSHIPFETPNATPLIDSTTTSSTPFSHRAIKVLSDAMKVVPPEGVDVNLSLDDFQTRHTSEDSASFDLIMEKHKQKLREKYAWAYEAETPQKLITSSQQQQPTLLLEGSKDGDNNNNTSNDNHVSTNTNNENSVNTAKPLIECGQGLLTWSHTAKNQLMYTPDGYKSLNLPPPSTKEIHRNNTRFQSNPFPIQPNKNTTQQQQQVYSMISINGELNPLAELRRLQALGMAPNEPNSNTNINMNNTYVPMTPSISPSSLTPFVTWGKIDGTPFLLDPNATPSGGPTFRVPEPLPREKVAIKLQEQASQKIKEKARLNAVGKKSTPLNGGMSPAIKELMKGRKASENYDKKLRQSYSSPSPRIFEAATPKPTFRSDFLTPEPKIRTPK